MDINELAEKCHNDARSMGWYDKHKQKTDLEMLMMVVSELSEAVEELRKPEPKQHYLSENGKPEGYGVEIADAIIRLLDYSAFKELNLKELIEEKLQYNLTRGYRHGNKQY